MSLAQKKKRDPSSLAEYRLPIVIFRTLWSVTNGNSLVIQSVFYNVSPLQISISLRTTTVMVTLIKPVSFAWPAHFSLLFTAREAVVQTTFLRVRKIQTNFKKLREDALRHDGKSSEKTHCDTTALNTTGIQESG